MRKRLDTWNLSIYSEYFYLIMFLLTDLRYFLSGSGVTRSEEGFMEACDCSSRCTASLCSCQDDSEIQDDDGTSRAFAYDAKVNIFQGLRIFLTDHTNYRDCLHSERLLRAMSLNATRHVSLCTWGRLTADTLLELSLWRTMSIPRRTTSSEISYRNFSHRKVWLGSPLTCFVSSGDCLRCLHRVCRLFFYPLTFNFSRFKLLFVVSPGSYCK